MWTTYQTFLIIMMLATGAINIISLKWSNITESEGKDGKLKKFNHPFFQAMLMFIGECLCYIVFKSLYHVYKRKEEGLEDENFLTKGNRDFNHFLLIIPAVCDLSATCLMFVGLLMTYISSLQMLNGAVIIFVGILSVIFLGRRLHWVQWLGIFILMGGLALVGFSDFLSQEGGETFAQRDIIIGDGCIIAAQLAVAIQMVVEEKVVAGQDIPALHAVGWEGIFGLTVIIVAQIGFYFIYANPPVTQSPGDRLEDPFDAIVQIVNSWKLSCASLLLIISIAFFNFSAISVTKELSALTRLVMNCARTIFLWIISMTVFDQEFHWLQPIGYILLVIGIFMYHQVNVFALCMKKKEGEDTTEAGGTQKK